MHHSLVDARVKISGGFWGLDPHWKTNDPHGKRWTEKLGGSSFDPPWPWAGANPKPWALHLPIPLKISTTTLQHKA